MSGSSDNDDDSSFDGLSPALFFPESPHITETSSENNQYLISCDNPFNPSNNNYLGWGLDPNFVSVEKSFSKIPLQNQCNDISINNNTSSLLSHHNTPPTSPPICSLIDISNSPSILPNLATDTSSRTIASPPIPILTSEKNSLSPFPSAPNYLPIQTPQPIPNNISPQKNRSPLVGFSAPILIQSPNQSFQQQNQQQQNQQQNDQDQQGGEHLSEFSLEGGMVSGGGSGRLRPIGKVGPVFVGAELDARLKKIEEYLEKIPGIDQNILAILSSITGSSGGVPTVTITPATSAATPGTITSGEVSTNPSSATAAEEEQPNQKQPSPSQETSATTTTSTEEVLTEEVAKNKSEVSPLQQSLSPSLQVQQSPQQLHQQAQVHHLAAQQISQSPPLTQEQMNNFLERSPLMQQMQQMHQLLLQNSAMSQQQSEILEDIHAHRNSEIEGNAEVVRRLQDQHSKMEKMLVESRVEIQLKTEGQRVLEHEIKQLKQTIVNLKSEKTHLTTEKDTLTAALEKSQAKAKAATEELAIKTQDLIKTQEKMNDLKEQYSNLKVTVREFMGRRTRNLAPTRAPGGLPGPDASGTIAAPMSATALEAARRTGAATPLGTSRSSISGHLRTVSETPTGRPKSVSYGKIDPSSPTNIVPSSQTLRQSRTGLTPTALKYLNKDSSGSQSSNPLQTSESFKKPEQEQDQQDQ
eukprot:c21144_g2_i2.p1 GENE.c21144_g2_i2~~c21144_g2_i2.p1  ORF type:complete len:696 (+),score=282.88 c21144_g2_i2:82-2169(+)